MPKITPFLWFDGQVEEVMEFYLSIFPDSRKIALMGPEGAARGATFEIQGQRINAFAGGPTFTLNEAFSLYVDCETQDEIDYYWEKLTEGGGEESKCGWLKDKFGVSWQVVPSVLPKYLNDPDDGRANRVLQAMLDMQKLDIAALEAAYSA